MTAPPSSALPGHRRLAERADVALDTCVETQAVEFMASHSWKSATWGVVKTACAMGNLRDGGIMTIGVSQRDDSWEASGVSEEDLKTYDVDKIVEQVSAYVSPQVDLTVVTHQKEGKTFIVIHVAQFRDAPLVCKKDHGRELAAGTVYVRPPGKPQTRKVLHASEMEELLELAADIRARRFLERLQRLDLLPGTTDQERFNQELEGL
jgi:predicted HTH transcriptional regulator